MLSAKKNVPKIKSLIKHEKQLTVFVSIFVILQIIFYILMKNVSFSLFAYICIITSCLFCVLLFDSSKAYRYTQIGLIATVGADFFLVFLPVQLRIPGMLCFCVTQIAYFLRIYNEDDCAKRKKVHLILRVIISILSLVVTAIVLGNRVDALSLISIFYYGHLILNVLFSFCSGKKIRVLAVALLFFILSDTLIGLGFLRSYFLIPRGSVIFIITQVCDRMIFPLYITSQTLIPLSLLQRKRKALKKEESGQFFED